ncbi:MAG: HNH endonuclease [Firmicutes bacterium]|nr:HNH endonuclease [Bacillota bacterium]
MPGKPYRVCNHPGCSQLVKPPARYCAAHQQKEAERRRGQQRHYDRYARNKKAKAFYQSKEWKGPGGARQRALVRDNHICQECLRHGRLTKAVTVHHIKPLLEFWELRLELSNLESVCLPCHNRKGH